MTENGDRILRVVQSLSDRINTIQLTTVETNSEVKLIKQEVTALKDQVVHNSEVLAGDPKRMGQGGLIHKQYEQDAELEAVRTELVADIEKVREDVKSIRGRFALIWTGIITGFNFLLSWLLRKVI